MSHVLVSVRAFDRRGYDGFCRGGRRWSSKEDTFAYVTPELLAALKAEKMLAVNEGAQLPKDVADDSVPRYELPPQPYVDPVAQAMDASRKVDAEIAALQAQLDLEAKQAKAAELRARLANKDKKADPPKK